MLSKGWQQLLKEISETPSYQSLMAFLDQRTAEGVTIYPPQDQWFRALELTPLESTRVVILGQDPYHQAGQAHGLSFSVLPGIQVPPSLRNIYKELSSDLGIAAPEHGFLEAWAEQGVLLLNAVLTVEDSNANAHQGKGWESVTDRIIQQVNEHSMGTVFILWGSYAQKKTSMIDQAKHLVIQSPHPSPLSAHRGFFGSQPFSKANSWLAEKGFSEINWELPVIGQADLFG
ncbi:Uracil-DNA glycosylase [Marinobacterium sp. xm-g-59]|uniref:uracil-DNA glycosylase n=1 Tax=Marinobacterium sp. xm-g-59 TaxID=2497748 RepID=UPI0015690C36|nr:uracil-DNA glycosylase [Marinobacterium sp. xm-g-59]NRP95546.1 Uracil-DNA glycosylase [Marinobacterium sp. xm-g-59]